MTRFITRRLATALLQLLILSVTVFFVIRCLPADPVARLVGLNATPEAYAEAKAYLGLDRTLLMQLASFLGIWPHAFGSGLLEGDLGKSWVTGTAVWSEISQYLPVTLELVTFSFLLACAFSVPAGLYAALHPGSKFDRVLFGYGLFAGSQPEFWWGLLFIYVFFFQLGWAPAPLGLISPLISPPPVVSGFMTIDAVIGGRMDALASIFAHLFIPVGTLAMIVSGPILKMTRQNASRALKSEFILYAHACGLEPGKISSYAMRVAFAPSLTLIGILYSYMLGGAVLIETVFSLNGIGQYAVRSILAFDYPAIQGVVLVISALSLVVYLVLDIIQVAVDPRIAR